MNTIYDNSYTVTNIEPLSNPINEKELSAYNLDALEEAIEKVKKDIAPYVATEAQLQAYPWLENAINGLTTVDELIYNYENNISDGSVKYTNTHLGSDFYTNEQTNQSHILTANLNTTIEYLAWDDAKYTKEGITNYSFEFKDSFHKESSNEIKDINLSIDIETNSQTVDTIRENYENLMDDLENNKKFKNNFYSKIESFMDKDDINSLKNYLSKILTENTQNTTSKENIQETISNSEEIDLSAFHTYA